MAAIQVGHAQHCQHVEVSGFKFIGSQKILDRLIESLDLIFEFGGGELGLEIIRLLVGLLHCGLDLTKDLLGIRTLISSDRWVVGWKILTLLSRGRTKTSREVALIN